MFASLRYVLTLALLLIAVSRAQFVFFTQYPTQVISGLAYPVSWEAGGATVSVDLLKGAAYQETLFFGTGTTFTWNVDDDDDGGTDYALRITPQGNEASALTSGVIWVIEDEDGVVVNGQVITASIPNGPTPSGLSSAATSTSIPATATGNTVATATATTGPRTETVTFSSVQSIYTFTTTITPTASNAPAGSQTLTFISGGLTFTTTISATTASGTATASASPNTPDNRERRLSGGATAGIVIGVIVMVTLLVCLLWFLRHRRLQRATHNGDTIQSPITTFINGGRRALSDQKSAVSAAGTTTMEHEKLAQRQSLVSPLSPDNPSEMDAGVIQGATQHTGSSCGTSEIDGRTRHEMNAIQPTYELPAKDVPRDRTSITQYPATCVSISRAGTASNNAATSTGGAVLRNT